MHDTTTDVKHSLIKGFFSSYPGEAANILNSFTSEDIIEYLRDLPERNANEVFVKLNPDIAGEVVHNMDDELFTRIFTSLDAFQATRLLLRLSKKNLTSRLKLLPKPRARELQELLNYPPDSAGHLMDPNVTTFYPENTVEEVLTRIRTLGDRRIVNIYVVDDSKSFLGIVPLQIVAVSKPEESLKDLIRPPLGLVNALSPIDEVVQLLEENKLIHLPVTDINNKLLGVIRNDELVHATKDEATEDVQAMFGAGREERALSKVSLAVKNRLPWLQINLATAFLAATVVGLFEETIAQITILAVFLPVVAGQSGNTGSQALAVTMRGLALREFPVSQWFKVARKEILVGLFNGIAVAITTSVIVYFWASSFGLAVVIGTSMVLSMVIAGFSGAVIPITLKAFGQDPATSSSIILTTVTDVFGFLSFLGLATALMGVLGIAG